VFLGKEISMTATVATDLQAYKVQQLSLWNVFALLYILLGYFGGVTLLCLSSFWLNGLGTLLLTHGLICSAYLAHDCMHSAVGKGRRLNALFGNAMLWINGGCYYGFDRLALQHIAHHVQRVDTFTFDIVATIAQQPRWIRQGILALEWCYFPIVSFWGRWRAFKVTIRASDRPQQRYFAIAFLLVRGTLFICLGILSSKALLLYGLSYLGMITALRWMDAFQHTYEAFPYGTKLPKRDRQNEQANTFSNLLSRQYARLNLLFLNFGYHNAHHAFMMCPWYHLPDLDRALHQTDETRYISFRQQVFLYHRFRVTRFLKGQGGASIKDGTLSFDSFYGAADVSFLTLY
jgi:fatty acid desaturase